MEVYSLYVLLGSKISSKVAPYGGHERLKETVRFSLLVWGRGLLDLEPLKNSLYLVELLCYIPLLLPQITTFNISLVVHGTVAEDNDFMKVHLWHN